MGRLSQTRLERERGLAGLATRQDGVVGRWQLAEMGFGEEAIRVMVESARLLRVHQGVFAVGHRKLSRRSWWWAAILAYGPSSVLSHRSAAAVWGLAPQGKRPIEVTAAGGRQGQRRRRGIRVHHCRLQAIDATVHDSFPVTTVARTLFDLGEAEGLESLRAAAMEANRLRRPWLAEMGAVCKRGRGRRGLRPARLLLADQQTPDEGRTPLEQRFAAFCREQHLPPAERNVTVLGHEVDVLWPGAKLVVELDSWEFHAHREAFEGDRARDPKLLLAGYRTIRITHRRLDREPEVLANQIKHLLERAPPAP